MAVRQAPFLLFLFIVYLTIGVYDQLFDQAGNPYDINSFIFTALFQPTQWTQSGLWILFAGAIVTSGAIAGIGAVLTKSDIITLSGVAGVLFSVGAIPIITVYNFVYRNANTFVCEAGDPCGAGTIAAVLIAGPLMLYWTYIVLGWWMWRETT